MSLKQRISNGIKKRIAITPKTWNLFFPLFKILPILAPYSGTPIIGPFLRKMTMLSPLDTCRTQSYVLSLNEDVTDASQGVVLPIDMMRQIVKDASLRVIINKCMCRTASDCKDFPHDIACIFLGEGARVAMENGVGHEASVEEALAHIEKAASHNLIGHALWIEVEQYVWGIRDEKMENWVELCFCCPCCCSAFKMARSGAIKEITSMFRSVGWKAVLDTNACTNCQSCVMRCPTKAITVGADHVNIDQETCLGCGFCASICPQEAITLNLQKPLKSDIQQYFEDGGLKLKI